MNIMKYFDWKRNMAIAMAAMMVAGGFTSCDNADAESTENPATETVLVSKKHDTAILLCTFGSTYKESLAVYDDIIADFEAQFGNEADIYLSFTSSTCIGRAEAATGVARYALSDWLDAIGEAGYERLAVQSLHVIPGEEYLSLMNTKIKKEFMIEDYPEIDILKGANLLSSDEDTEDVADVLYEHYASILADKHNLLLMMGHGNPDVLYNANQKYIDIQDAMLARAANGNVFVGTVDYGDMMFWPGEDEEDDRVPIMSAEEMIAEYPTCIYSLVMNYCIENDLDPSEITCYLTPFMSIAGDHAHNDLWGLEALAETDTEEYYEEEVELNSNDYSWRERLTKIGFNIGQAEIHPIDEVDADHGVESGCGIRALGSYPAIRKIWLRHLTELWDDEDAWENGEDYQP